MPGVDLSRLHLAATIGRGRVWTYATQRDDALAPGFFDAAARMVAPGDTVVLTGPLRGEVTILSCIGDSRVVFDGLFATHA